MDVLLIDNVSKAWHMAKKST